MTDIFVVPAPLLQTASIVYEPHQVPVVKYNDHARAMCELERRVDRAYSQRNNAAVALVRMALLLGWPAGRGLDDKTGQHVVYLDLPNGEQVSYHMAPSEVHLLDGLPEYTGKWDGKFTGTTTWAGMVPAPGWVTDMDYRPEELGDPDSEPWRALCEREADHAAQVMGDGDFDPAEVDRLMQGVPEGDTVQVTQLSSDAWPKPLLTLPFRLDMPVPENASDWELPKDRAPVPKAPFPPGVCACPKCEQPREAGKLFCAPHRSVDGRFRDSHPMTNERLAYMMQRDGEQQ